jgi:hypothetical protein
LYNKLAAWLAIGILAAWLAVDIFSIYSLLC